MDPSTPSEPAPETSGHAQAAQPPAPEPTAAAPRPPTGGPQGIPPHDTPGTTPEPAVGTPQDGPGNAAEPAPADAAGTAEHTTPETGAAQPGAAQPGWASGTAEHDTPEVATASPWQYPGPVASWPPPCGPERPGTPEPGPRGPLNGPPHGLPHEPHRPPHEPPAAERVVDPPAAALANASLLGVGYLMLGRRRAAALAGLVTVVLLVLLASITRSAWLEVAVLLWWVVVIAHAWRLAGGRGRTPGPRARRQRLVALAGTLPVLLAVGFLRFDAAGVERDAAQARAAGDCPAAVAAVDRLWFGHHLANAPLTARGDDTVRACTRLDTAAGQLRTALTGDTQALDNGFTGLTTALAELPGYDAVVERVLDGFLAGLPTKDACDTRDITAWLRERGNQGNALDRVTEVVPRVAPEAIVQCADSHMASTSFVRARELYQELLDEHPDHQLAPRAGEGVQKATWAIELGTVRSLLSSPSPDRPEYCDKPSPYSAAAPYGAQSPNRAWVAGRNEHTNRLPGDWVVDDVANAAVVICAGAVAHGSVAQTCTYLYSGVLSGEKDVSFHRIAIPVRVYEVKTGRLITSTTLEVNGESCPSVVNYTTYNRLDTGPAADMYVTASDADVHAAFNPLINP